MRNGSGSRQRFSNKPQRTTPESLILGCVNRGSTTTLMMPDLVRTMKAPQPTGHDEAIARMFLELEPKVLALYFPSRGVDHVALVGAYERAKGSTGIRSQPFERFFSGRFAFTS